MNFFMLKSYESSTVTYILVYQKQQVTQNKTLKKSS